MDEPKIFRNDPNFKPEAKFLSEKSFTDMLDSHPILCADVLFINSKERNFLLPKRVRKPAEGLWFIGGTIKRNTTPKEALLKIVERETSLILDENKLKYLTANWFEWNYRDNKPTENGRIDFNLCYTYELDQKELERINKKLDPEEYDLDHGIRPYSKEKLIKSLENESPCKQILLHCYEKVFG